MTRKPMPKRFGRRWARRGSDRGARWGEKWLDAFNDKAITFGEAASGQFYYFTATNETRPPIESAC